MKKSKLKLKDLQVKSFVTLNAKEELKNLNGGRVPARGTHYEWCEN